MENDMTTIQEEYNRNAVEVMRELLRKSRMDNEETTKKYQAKTEDLMRQIQEVTMEKLDAEFRVIETQNQAHFDQHILEEAHRRKVDRENSEQLRVSTIVATIAMSVIALIMSICLYTCDIPKLIVEVIVGGSALLGATFGWAFRGIAEVLKL